MQKNFYQLRCVGCKKIVSEEDSVAVCLHCGEALQVEIPPAELAARVKKGFQKSAAISGKKYLPFYPLHSPEKAISFGEGNTPLIRLEKIGKQLKQPNLYVKNEGQNPTGVFKDRGSLVEISKALELGAKAVVVASTGNMAASVSAYCAVAGLPCYVLIPENTPLGKLSQAIGYGARILSIRGTYADCCVLAEKMAAKYKYYLAGDYVFRSEGQKTLAFEVIEQLGWKSPDAVIVPVGCGTNIAAIWQGFREFHQLGFIKKLPRMIAVQPDGCSTIVAAFQKKMRKSPFVAHPQTVCSAVGIGKPLDDIKALQALQQSHGCAITIPDSVTLQMQSQLGSLEAIFVEPSGALPVACIAALRKKKLIKADEVVVCVATGVGLKDSQSILASHPTPPSVEPDMREVDRFLKFKLYAIRAAGFQEKEKILFKKTPSLAILEKTIRKEFNANLKATHLEEILESITSFLAKGKPIAKADLQNMVEAKLTDLTYEKRVMRVIDYELQIHKTTPPQAKVSVEFLGEKLTAEAQGVGPVDAVITAIRKALEGKSKLGEKLVDFAVNIEDKGTDASTGVTMGLIDKNKNTVKATATSPDIITASIAAFEKGYNILYWKSQQNKNRVE